MTLWWLQPGWDQACCANCGAKIAPEGDPDWGVCWPCMEERTRYEEEQRRYEEEQRQQESAAMEEHFRRHPHG